MFHNCAIASLVVVSTASDLRLAKADPSPVRIEITGVILPVCAQSGVSTIMTLDRLDRAGETTVPFAVDCNAPFRYRIESSNGGFATLGRVSTSKKFANLIPYSVAVNISLNGGNIEDRCESTGIKAPAFSCRLSTSGAKVAIGKTGFLNVSWAEPPKALLSGSYQDRLTISFSIQP